MRENKFEARKALEEYKEESVLKMQAEEVEMELGMRAQEERSYSLYAGLIKHVNSFLGAKWIERVYFMERHNFTPDLIRAKIKDDDLIGAEICSALDKLLIGNS